jgi:hypothetical protein
MTAWQCRSAPGVPDVTAARAALTAGDWPAVESWFSTIDDECIRAALARLRPRAADEPFLKQVAGDTGSALAYLMLALSLLDAAHVLVRRRAVALSAAKIEGFYHFYVLAEAQLAGIVIREPSYLAAWTTYLEVGVTLQRDPAEMRRRYAAASVHHPASLVVHATYLASHCPAYGGCAESMHEFARACADDAPPGSDLGLLVALAHWYDARSGNRAARRRYFRDPAVLADVADAAARSVLHESHDRSHGCASAHALLARVFSLGGRPVEAAVHFRALGDSPDPDAWGSRRADRRAFRRHRARALSGRVGRGPQEPLVRVPQPPRGAPASSSGFVEIDPHPEMAAARDALAAGDWPGVRAYLASLNDADSLSCAVSCVVGDEANAALLRRALRADPDDELARLARGACLVKAAHAMTIPATFPTGTRWRRYKDLLAQAEIVLEPLAARHPVAAQLLLQISYRLQMPIEETWRRYEAAIALHPDFRTAQFSMLIALAPKWTGDIEAMYDFAYECSEEAPMGSDVHVFMIAALFEHRFVLSARARRALLRGPKTLKLLADAAARSVLHPDYEINAGTPTDHALFAAGFSLAGDHAAAAPHFRAMSEYPSIYPWCYEPNPQRAFAKHRARALRKG